jgi:hypothetical protein
VKRLFAHFVLGFCVVACGEDERDLFVVQYDAGSEGGDAAGTPDAADQLDPTLGGPCTEDGQCDDQIPCTADRCDQMLKRCRNTPDDGLCQDDVYCNGKERCVLRQGCAPGPVVTCQDDNPCTIDRCIEESKTCVHDQRDADGDGDPDDHCITDKDCDDLDPTVSSTASEICANGKDDDCDGTVDEAECATAKNDVCGTGQVVTAPGTYLLTTVAAKRSYASTCAVGNANASRDVALKITAPSGNGVNVLVSARTHNPPNEIAVALVDTCPDPPAGQLQSITPVSCGYTKATQDARAIRRHLAAGETVYAVIATQQESALDVQVDYLPEADAPANETCATATPIAQADLGNPFIVSLVDPKEDVATACDRAKTGELLYSFVLDAPKDVRIFSSTTYGTGRAVVGIHDGTCTETRCRVSGSLPAFARLAGGTTHYFSVSASSQIDASIVVQTSPQTPAPATQSCATTTSILPNESKIVDLSTHEDAIKDGCFPGSAAAAFKLDLAVTSDLLAIGRFPLTEVGAISIHDGVACDSSTRRTCAIAARPARASQRALPPGSYWVVIADENGQTVKLDALVRPYEPPVTVTTSNGCTDTITIPETGGFFTGDNTVGATADFDASCDAAGLPLGGAPDRILKLVLTQKRRVVLDMQGSFYTTLLDVRTGATCPGTEIANGCFVGSSAAKSFLDLELDAGTYWIQVDGYAGDAGKWNLDVRVLPPSP